MQPDQLISVSDFCLYHHVAITFINVLEQRGLIETITIQEAIYVQPAQLGRLEKLVRLHQELAIHADDLDVVNDLLERVETLQHQVKQLQNRLVFYESQES